MKKLLKILEILGGVVIILGVIFYFVSWYGFIKERQDVNFGITFSTVMARQLGLDPRATFDALLDDLGATKIRLPVYWPDVESGEGKFIFDDYDYFVKKSEEKRAQLILAVGRKLPRWPECHEPRWARDQESRIKNQGLQNYIKTVIERYKNSPAVEAWQMENEPFFRFGAGCAGENIKPETIEKEVAIIRSLDSRPIIITDSGEQGLWLDAARPGDVLGITLYRQVWGKTFGFVRAPQGPGFYALKNWLFQKLAGPKKVFVVELQVEPWGPGKLLPDYDIKIQKELMNVDRFRDTISYARRTGLDVFYLWGAEWFYWLKEKQNDPSLWEEARLLLIKK